MTKLEVLEPEKNMKKFADDPLLSFIVPVYEKDPMVFKRCLMSLADQDYENKEVIVIQKESKSVRIIVISKRKVAALISDWIRSRPN